MNVLKYRRLFVRTLAVVAALMLPVELMAAAPSPEEMLLLRERVVEVETAPARLALTVDNKSALPQCYAADEAPVVSEGDLASIASLIRKDGTFSDIDYDNRDRSAWSVARHLNYCRMMAVALKTLPPETVSRYHLRRDCLRALDWWLHHQPHNSNWWSNDVLVAQMLGSIGLLLGDDVLGEARRAAILRLTESVRPGRTGQNLMWLSWNSLLAGLLANDGKRVAEAMDSLGATITVSKPWEEGIQIDMSFQQHGPQLYQGNYGRHYLHSASKFIRVARGTRWEDAGKNALVEKYLLEGTRRMCWGRLLDYSTWGRQITYNDRFQGPDLIYACDNLLAAGTARAEEVAGFARTLSGPIWRGNPPRPELAGSRAFPMSDYIVHRSPGFMTSVRMSSTRTVIGEITNGDNLLGAYLSVGAMLTYQTGGEYEGIFPCWDWTCIPGTTAKRGYMPPKWSSSRGSSAFAGCMDEGIAAMQIDHFGVKAGKSWFFFPDRVICLGSGISSGAEGGKARMVTTIEQNLLSSTQGVKQSQSGKTHGILHNNTLYLLRKKDKPLVETGKRTGSWDRIRSSSTDDKVVKPVFLLAIDHGVNAVNASYAYQVFPVRPAGVSLDRLWDEIPVLRHDEKVHAISHAGVVKAVFFKPETLTLPGGQSFTVTEACLAVIDVSGGNYSIAIPGRISGETKVMVNGKSTTVVLQNAAR